MIRRLSAIFGTLWLIAPGVANAVEIDFASGTPGAIFSDQPFNETRGVVFQVTSPQDLAVHSISLDRFHIVNNTQAAFSATVGARIYTIEGTLIASSDLAVGAGVGQSVTIPITTLLDSGSSYVAGVLISAGSSGRTGDFFDPTPIGVSVTPYADNSGLVEVLAGRSVESDAFPTRLDRFVPLITIEAAAIPEPSAAVLAVGALAAASSSWRRR